MALYARPAARTPARIRRHPAALRRGCCLACVLRPPFRVCRFAWPPAPTRALHVISSPGMGQNEAPPLLGGSSYIPGERHAHSRARNNSCCRVHVSVALPVAALRMPCARARRSHTHTHTRTHAQKRQSPSMAIMMSVTVTTRATRHWLLVRLMRTPPQSPLETWLGSCPPKAPVARPRRRSGRPRHGPRGAAEAAGRMATIGKERRWK